MEEFYRRKYLSPTHSRVQTYLDALQTNTSLQLRKERLRQQSIEEQYYSISIEIAALEKQNQKLEHLNQQVQQQHLEKIKNNKITIIDAQKEIQNFTTLIQQSLSQKKKLDQENQKLISLIQAEKQKITTIFKQNQARQIDSKEQQEYMVELENKIEEIVKLNEKIKQSNSEKKQQLQQFNIKLREAEIQLEGKKEEEKQLTNEVSKASLILQKQIDEKYKFENSRNQHLQSQIQIMAQEKEGMERKYLKLHHEKTLEKDSRSTSKQTQETCVENFQKMKELEQIIEKVLKASKEANDDRTYHEMISKQSCEIKAKNEKLEEELKALCSKVEQEQQVYNNYVQQMKETIVQDQQAIQYFSQQADLISKLIA